MGDINIINYIYGEMSFFLFSDRKKNIADLFFHVFLHEYNEYKYKFKNKVKTQELNGLKLTKKHALLK